jgi:hypothetical protein
MSNGPDHMDRQVPEPSHRVSHRVGNKAEFQAGIAPHSMWTRETTLTRFWLSEISMRSGEARVRGGCTPMCPKKIRYTEYRVQSCYFHPRRSLSDHRINGSMCQNVSSSEKNNVRFDLTRSSQDHQTTIDRPINNCLATIEPRKIRA